VWGAPASTTSGPRRVSLRGKEAGQSQHGAKRRSEAETYVAAEGKVAGITWAARRAEWPAASAVAGATTATRGVACARWMIALGVMIATAVVSATIGAVLTLEADAPAARVVRHRHRRRKRIAALMKRGGGTVHREGVVAQLPAPGLVCPRIELRPLPRADQA
jgi:hypothetical protein